MHTIHHAHDGQEEYVSRRHEPGMIEKDKELDFEFPVLVDTLATTMNMLGISSVPTAIHVDEEGQIKRIATGAGLGTRALLRLIAEEHQGNL